MISKRAVRATPVMLSLAFTLAALPAGSGCKKKNAAPADHESTVETAGQGVDPAIAETEAKLAKARRELEEALNQREAERAAGDATPAGDDQTSASDAGGLKAGEPLDKRIPRLRAMVRALEIKLQGQLNSGDR